jgi:hypothetical protein
VVLDIGANGQLDITSAEMLVQLAGTLRGAGIDLALAEVHGQVLETAAYAGVLDTLGANHVFHTLDEAAQALSPAGAPDAAGAGAHAR